MSDLAAKLRALVVSNPGDKAARGVYADALMQEGDPRGTYITLQSHLEGRLSPDKRESAKRQCAKLLRENAASWLAPVTGWAEVRWKGGFVHAIRATAAAFVAKGPALVEQEPVLEVTLTRASNQDVEALAASPAIAKLAYLAVSGSFQDKAAGKLAASPHAKRIASLHLTGAGVGSAFAEASSNLEGLISLCLTGMGMGDDAMESLGAGLPIVERLYLARNELSDEGVSALVAASLAKLQLLCLGGNEITDEGARAIAEAKLGALRHLELNQTQVSDEGATAIAKSKTLGSLRKLDVRQTECGGIKARSGLTVIAY